MAANGVEGVSRVREARFDLILMDCLMPEMDGWQASEKIRQFEKGVTPQFIVAVTAIASASAASVPSAKPTKRSSAKPAAPASTSAADLAAALRTYLELLP